MRIAIIDDYSRAFANLRCAAKLGGHRLDIFHDAPRDADELAARLAEAEAVLLTQQRTALPRAILERLPRLRLISQTGRNVDHIDIAACRALGITVCAGGGGGVEATAELTWALILAALRHIPEEVQRLRSGQWQGSLGTGVSGRVLGLYGLGRIGGRVARVGEAFGMRILCWGREGTWERAAAAGYAVADSRERFFAESDVLSLHIRLTPDTRGVVTAADLARMKPGALLVNTSRAPIIEAGALEAALRQGRPGRAAVDVYEEEPVLGGRHPLLALPNALCTPHLGYVEEATYETLYDTAVEQILAFEAGRPINLLEPAPG
ncbi:D-2-hydroxyacid dehydrogenase family protein [Teichococcus aestuarii]|uniref:3-phosphoglycerate dehydrogenase n=1 Tax=Teichococcus aestuarii TaxID=568898 RepID=A0A2U1V526_9PROT|nr:D-2-hydroxyacid dehydrogenase family protein [Pseudoroseomonas aestuarii]PWC29019.1 3-phosphoglycerate dehydrogenase [Pseudoroseomonas aestuarii]